MGQGSCWLLSLWLLSHSGRHITTSVLEALALLLFVKWIPDSNLSFHSIHFKLKERKDLNQEYL